MIGGMVGQENLLNIALMLTSKKHIGKGKNMGITKQCKRCKRRYKTLVRGVCANCDPVAWDVHWKKVYDVEKNK